MIIINARFLTQKITGVQRFAVEICRRLPESIQGKPIIFVAPKGVLVNTIEKKIQQFGRFKGQLWEQIDLPLYLKKQENLLLINLVGIAPVFYKNKIMFLYDLAFKHHPEWFSFSFQKMYNLFIPISLKNSRTIITDSNYVKLDIVKTYNVAENKIHVIYAAQSSKFVNKNGVREKIILTVSSIDPRKNLERIINAFNTLKSDYKLVVIGQKNNTFANIQLDKEIQNENIIFTGYLSDENLIDYYNKAELFIYGSLFEGFGIPPLEAQACGCACMVSKVTSLPEVYENSVEYFDPYSIESIATKMNEMINDKDKIEKLRSRGALNLKRFSWVVSTNKLTAIIEELL
jgi:glycosyltransferase involved in cell wall biosynthesis